MKQQRTYSPELKSEAVKLYIEGGLTHEEVVRRLSVPKGTVGNWMAAAKAGRVPVAPGEMSVAQLVEENRKPKKELSEVKLEQEFLRKAH